MINKKKRAKDANFIFMKKTRGESIVHAVAFVFLLAWSISYLFPLFWLAVQSFHDRNLYNLIMLREGAFAIPEIWNWKNYPDALSMMQYNNVQFVEMLFNSLWYIGIAETWCLFWPVLVGYIFAKYEFRGKGTLYAIIIFALTIPIAGTTGAFYKLVDILNLYDTGPIFVIVTGIGGFSSGFLIYYGIFKGISWSYAESVFIDGGGNLTAFLRVMLPQAMPAISAMMVSALIGYWNETYQFMMYLPSTPTVATGLYFISLTIDRFGKPLYYAGLIISMIPVLILYGLMAEKMMKNLSIGGLKG
jgi:ABC-type glycerol-3-phosphate transport system permease component